MHNDAQKNHHKYLDSIYWFSFWVGAGVPFAGFIMLSIVLPEMQNNEALTFILMAFTMIISIVAIVTASRVMVTKNTPAALPAERNEQWPTYQKEETEPV